MGLCLSVSTGMDSKNQRYENHKLQEVAYTIPLMYLPRYIKLRQIIYHLFV